MKHCLSLIITACCVLLIEGALWVFHPGNLPSTDQSQLLHMAYHKPIRVERLLAVTKFDAFVGEQAEFVQIGESSGLVSVNPAIINTYLPKDWRYLNASLQVPAQFESMEALADRILRKDKKRKYLVGVFSIFHLGKEDEGFGQEVVLNYNSIWRHLLKLPSLRYRESVTRYVYYGGALPPELDYKAILTGMHSQVITTDGWFGVDFKRPYTPHPCGAVMFRPEVARDRQERLAALAKRYGVTLIMTMGPIHCDPDESIKVIQQEFAEFREAHPEVIFPMPIPFSMPSDLFGDEVHVNPGGADIFSHTLGTALQKALSGTATPAFSSPGR